jgi:hypothetical protein
VERAKKNTRIGVHGVPAVFALTFAAAFPLSAQQTPAQPEVLTSAVVNDPVQFDSSPPLRDIPVQIPPRVSGPYLVNPPLRPKLQQLQGATQQPGLPVGTTPPRFGSATVAASIGLNFDGIGQNATNNCPSLSGFFVAPPDTNAAVGDTQVVQWVNLCYAVFDKLTGALLGGPFPGNHFWAGFGGACEASNSGDPIIQWDKANHVWVASQNVFSLPYQTCIAVSTTGDATGSYNRYAFSQPGFPDYPKWGLTPNIYFQTQNDFGPGGARFAGVNVCGYDAAAMRAGKTAKQICILDSSNHTLFDDSMLPADNDNVSAINAPEVLLGSIDNLNPGSNVYEYVFTVNFTTGTASLAGVNGSMPIAVPTYSLACGGFGACIRQPGVTDLLDSLGDRLMYRLAVFDDGTTRHFLVTHSVNNTTATAVRWYEFRAPDNSPTVLTLFQSGNTPDDGKFRWMASIAYDKNGDIAVGYSRSSAAPGDFPSIYLAGQTAGEPRGTTDAESQIFQGSGSQTDTSSRWGDYSSMALDGADLCSFWYTTEYYPATGSFAWNTRVAGKIKFKGCK